MELLARFGKVFIVVLVVSLVLEIGLFNIKHWETLGNREQAVSMTQSHEGSSEVYQAQVDNASVNAIALDLNYEGNSTVDVTVSIIDSGTAAQSYDLPQQTYYSSGRKYLVIETYGYLKSLAITVEQPSNATVSVSNVSLNPQIPFCFEAKRFVLVLAVLLIVGLVRPGSKLWKLRMGERSTASRVASVGALALAVFLALISFSGPTDDADAPWYNTFAYNEYTQLAHSFAHGKLYLEEEPPSWLQEMDGLDAGEDRLLGDDNVYDVSKREELGALTGSYCKDDAAYYNGHYYVYFGVVPVVLLYLPVYLLTGMDLSDSFAVLFAILMFIVFSWLLLREVCSKWFSRASTAAFLVGFATLLCASGIVISLGRPQFYNEPVVFALMFGVLGLFLVAKGYKTKTGWQSCVLLFFGALCIALIAGCRPQLLLLGAALLWIGYRICRREKKRLRAAKIASICVPVVVVAALIMWYNFARFGSVFDFGANYNLAGNDMTLRDFSIVRSIEGIVYYLFATPHVTTAFPFFQAFYPDSSYMSINMSEPLVMGVFIQCPMLFAIVYFLATNRGSRFWLPVGWLALAGVVIAVFDANAAGILGRYAQDFGVFFGLAAAVVLFEVDAQGRTTGFIRGLIAALLVAMVLFTITFRLSLMTRDSTPTGPRESTSMIMEAQPLAEFWR